MVFMERLSVAVLLAAFILVHLSVGAPTPHHLNGAPHDSEQAAQLSSLSTSQHQEAVIRLMIRRRDPHADNGIQSPTGAVYNDITHVSNDQVGNKAVIGQPNMFEQRSANDLSQLSAPTSPLQTRTSHLDEYNDAGGLTTDQPDPEHILLADNRLSTEDKSSNKHQPSKLTSWSTGNKQNLDGDAKTAERVPDSLTSRINNAPLSIAQNA
ncbi:hypothetical protein PCANC_07565 [Puccinia coronata f. sp. avenae]|uniref:Uncharacterized protein n=1 Tax=Puccinia coronata f. sp. avenae TaxID=200324 RepID=A0A2N5VSM0_9BASI|nr:hypothetical protein PCANC_07565 [Puccinia coronata f. sp. avenae]